MILAFRGTQFLSVRQLLLAVASVGADDGRLPAPRQVNEWVCDATCMPESAGDYLAAGEAHKVRRHRLEAARWRSPMLKPMLGRGQGFYDKIFPSATEDMRVIPYIQIIDAIKCVRGH